MSQKVNLGRKGFVRRAYVNTIDTSFTQLVPPPPPIENVITVEEFFELYKNLFYEIPAEGESNSHRFMINKSMEYVGFTEEKDQDIQVLLDEISLLRRELLDAQSELLTFESNQSTLENQGENELVQQLQNELASQTQVPQNIVYGTDSQGAQVVLANPKSSK